MYEVGENYEWKVKRMAELMKRNGNDFRGILFKCVWN